MHMHGITGDSGRLASVLTKASRQKLRSGVGPSAAAHDTRAAYPLEVTMSGLLDGKVAIVTGGTSGIGLATVERYVNEGAKVAIADIQDDLGASVAERLGASVSYVHTDVTDEAAIEALITQTVDKFGKLDII